MNKQDFRSLMEEVHDWSTDNFSEQPHEYPLIGVCEEFGEFCTSALKILQGIDDSEKYDGELGKEAEIDAVGDVLVYLADYCARKGIEPRIGNRRAKQKATEPESDVDAVFLDVAVDFFVRDTVSEFGVDFDVLGFNIFPDLFKCVFADFLEFSYQVGHHVAGACDPYIGYIEHVELCVVFFC